MTTIFKQVRKHAASTSSRGTPAGGGGFTHNVHLTKIWGGDNCISRYNSYGLSLQGTLRVFFGFVLDWDFSNNSAIYCKIGNHRFDFNIAFNVEIDNHFINDSIAGTIGNCPYGVFSDFMQEISANIGKYYCVLYTESSGNISFNDMVEIPIYAEGVAEPIAIADSQWCVTGSDLTKDCCEI